MPKGNKAIRDVLKGDLLTQLNEVWRKGENYLDNQRGDNNQGTKHCKTVEGNLGKLIPDEKKETGLKPIELFVLSAAACLHDIGKVVTDDANGWKSDHGHRSMEIIMSEYDKLGLEKLQAVALGYVVSVHGDGKLDQLPRTPLAIGNEEVNLIELAAIFRLGDMLDTNYQRAPEILSRIKFPDGNIPPKWKARQSVSGWYLDEKDRIILQAVPKLEETDALYALKSMMTEDLALISPYLKLYDYPSEIGELDVGDVFLKTDLKKKAVSQRPFPGMAFYTQEDRAIFKGRDKETEDLLSIVGNWPISLLIGESGAGKTSLIHAGLFPKLDAMGWRYAWTRPFNDPEENIKKMLWAAFFKGAAPKGKNLLDVMKEAADKFKPRQLLVVMDQFEDVLNCSVPELLESFCLRLTAVQTGTVVPNLRVLISFREDAWVKLNARLLKRITGSARQFPSVELERLTQEGAKAAFLSGLENAGMGLSPLQEENQRPLIDIILDDIRKGDDRLYPPYFQMVAETLSLKATTGNPVITREMYSQQLEGAEKIIARYLMEHLKEFGPQKEKAEKVLVILTTSAGKKAQKTLAELSQATDTASDELQDIIEKMVNLRMVRTVGDNEFEIIHDYLGKIVDEELVDEEARTIKYLEEQLESFHQQYKVHGTPIMSPPFMASLYKNRKRIIISEEKYPLLFSTSLSVNVALGWYWLKDIDIQRVVVIIKDFWSKGLEDVANKAMDEFVKMAKTSDRNYIINMLNDSDEFTRHIGMRSLSKIVEPVDKNSILQTLESEDAFIRYFAAKAFVKIATHSDLDKILKMLHHRDDDIRNSAVEAFINVVRPEDKYIITKMLDNDNELVKEAASMAFVEITQSEDRDKIIEILNKGVWGLVDAVAALLSKISIDEFADMREDATFSQDTLSRKIYSAILSELSEADSSGTNIPREGMFSEIRKFGKISDMLLSEDSTTRGRALDALGWIAEPGDYKRLYISSLNIDWNTLKTFLESFLKVAIPEDRDRIIELLYSKELDVQKAAAKAFARTTQHKDSDKILKMLDDTDEYIRETAIEACNKISQTKLRKRIFEMLEEKDRVAESTALKAFTKIVEANDREKILEMMTDDDWRIQVAAAEMFLKIALPEDEEKLIGLIYHGHGTIRSVAGKTLMKLMSRKKLECLLDELADKAQRWSEEQEIYFDSLRDLDRILYCPYSEDEKVKFYEQ